MRLQFITLTLTRGSASLILAICNVLVARWAGPTAFGPLATIISAGAFYFVAADFGFSTFLSRAAARNERADIAAGLRLNTYTSVAGGALACVVIAIVAVMSGFSEFLILAGASMALENNADTAVNVPIARADKVTPTISILVRRVICIGVLVGAHLIWDDSIAAYAIGLFAGAVAGQLYTRSKLRADYQHVPSPLGQIWKASFPFFISNVTASARNLDVVVVSMFANVRAAGLYAAAQKLTSPFMLIPSTLAALVMPASARKSPAEAFRVAMQLTAVFGGLTLILAVVAHFSPFFVALVFGPKYAASAPILAWTLIAFPIVAVASPLGGVLQSQGEEKAVATNGVIFTAILLVGLWLSTSIWGPAGAAIALASVFTAKVLSLLYLIFTRLRRPTAGSGRQARHGKPLTSREEATHA